MRPQAEAVGCPRRDCRGSARKARPVFVWDSGGGAVTLGPGGEIRAGALVAFRSCVCNAAVSALWLGMVSGAAVTGVVLSLVQTEGEVPAVTLAVSPCSCYPGL